MRFIEVSKKVQEFLESIYFKYPVTSNFSIEWNSIFSFFFCRLEINEKKIERKKLVTWCYRSKFGESWTRLDSNRKVNALVKDKRWN